MKNLLVFISPQKKFYGEHAALVKVQIDNSLLLGWKLKDIILVTNFPYQYGSLKALEVGDEVYCEHSPISTKITAVVELFKKKLINKDELYWLHDLDAFQLVEIPESEIEIEKDEIGVCDYGRMPKCAGGSVFFRLGAKKVFEKIKEKLFELKTVDEVAMTALIDEGETRIKKMNISYNFLTFNVRSCYQMAIKPLRVAHFHPTKGVRQSGITNAFDWFKGNNKINTQLIPNRLIKLLNYHGVRG
jgi:hypothetical protein